MMQSAIEQYLKEKTLHSWASCSRGSFTTQKKPIAYYNSCTLKFLLQRQVKSSQVSASTTEERKVFHHWFRRQELNCDAWKRLFSFSLQNCLFVCYAWMSFCHMTLFCILNKMLSVSCSAISNKLAWLGTIHQNLKFKAIKLCDFKMI